MLRVKYYLYNGGAPYTSIKGAVPGLQDSNIFIGAWPRNISAVDWLYGEIDTNSGNLSAILNACTNYGMASLTDAEALTWVDAALPTNTVLQPKLTAQAADIDITTNRVRKLYTETW